MRKLTKDFIKVVNRDFNDLLKKCDNPPGTLASEFRAMQNKMIKKRCLAGGKVLPTFIKPIFFTTRQILYFREIVEILLSCQEKLINLYFKSEEYRNLFELTETEKPLVEIKSRLPRWIYFSRLDSIMTEDRLMFLEFNCDSPGGALFADIQTECLLQISVMKELAKKYKFVIENYRDKVLKTMISAWKELGMTRKPSIVVMGNPEVSNVDEFKLFARFFGVNGFKSFFTDPWSLDYNGNELTKKGRKIDMIYRRGVLADYSQHVEESKPVIDAYKDGNVCFVNPLGAKLGDNKNLLSLLTDEKMKFLFTNVELDVIKRHIPWTRMFRECKTTYKDREIDLVPHIRDNKDSFVLKPNSEYGGKGVVIGIETDQKAWERAVDESLLKPMVTQEYVPIPEEEFPVFNPDLCFQSKKVNINFLTFHGQYGGGFARTSDSLVINVSRGGALATFIVIDESF
ncbi:hypothetical protein KKB18_06160 [bacterium]|nr:hypothetical protein [bacterium]